MSEQSDQDSSKEPKDAQEKMKEKSTFTSEGSTSLGRGEVKTTSSSSSFEDFSSYRKEISKESAKVDSAMLAVAKEREEKIKNLMKEQEAETARRIAEGVKFGSDSSESICAITRRFNAKLKQAKKQQSCKGPCNVANQDADKNKAEEGK